MMQKIICIIVHNSVEAVLWKCHGIITRES